MIRNKLKQLLLLLWICFLVEFNDETHIRVIHKLICIQFICRIVLLQHVQNRNIFFIFYYLILFLIIHVYINLQIQIWFLLFLIVSTISSLIIVVVVIVVIIYFFIRLMQLFFCFGFLFIL